MGMGTRGADAEELEQFYRLHSVRLSRLALFLARNREDATDVLQATLVRCLIHWGKIRASADQLAYVRRMLVNEFNRSKAKPSPQVPVERVDSLAWEDDVVAKLTVFDFVRRLSLNQRTAIYLRFIEGLSEQETAKIMRCPQGTVKSHTSRGLAEVRRLVADHDEDWSTRSI